jgi:protein SCO1/2
MSVKMVRIALVIVAVSAVGAAFGYQYGLFGPARDSHGRSGVALIGGPFALVDQNGRTRRDTDYRGSLMLIYFGYTFCPDVCPTALQIMTVALDSLGAAGEDIQPILITVDPRRDTVTQLKAYAANFHPRLVALTGTEQAVAGAQRAYKVYSAIPEGQESQSDYLVDHTSIIYLMGRDGRYLTHFSHTTSAEAMAAAIRRHL